MDGGAANGALIVAQGVGRVFRTGAEEVRAVDGVSLEVASGELLAIVGRSGSGKTTLLNLLAGIDRPTRGSLMVDGKAIHDLSNSALSAWRSRAVGYIFQLYNLVPVLTAYENIELPLLLHNLSRKKRHAKVSAALDLVGIGDRHAHYPRQLSGGQEQRVAIARAIVTDPTLILADEPTGDLDRTSATSIMNLLARLNTDLGRTIVMVTHDPKTTAWADTVLLLEKGRLIENEEVIS